MRSTWLSVEAIGMISCTVGSWDESRVFLRRLKGSFKVGLSVELRLPTSACMQLDLLKVPAAQRIPYGKCCRWPKLLTPQTCIAAG
jgi:hypothetical protein